MEFVLFWLFVLYLVPTVVAAARAHHRSTTLLFANLALGWTIVGWLALLLYAMRSEPQPPRPKLPSNVVPIHPHRWHRSGRVQPPTRPLSRRAGELVVFGASARAGSQDHVDPQP